MFRQELQTKITKTTYVIYGIRDDFGERASSLKRDLSKIPDEAKLIEIIEVSDGSYTLRFEKEEENERKGLTD